MKLWEILRPVRFNNGRAISSALVRRWNRHVLRLVGGLTTLPRVAGQWRDPSTGRVYREPMQPVQIASTRARAASIARYTARLFRQRSVMFCATGSDVTFT
jgi:hypothetical protein